MSTILQRYGPDVAIQSMDSFHRYKKPQKSGQNKIIRDIKWDLRLNQLTLQFPALVFIYYFFRGIPCFCLSRKIYLPKYQFLSVHYFRGMYLSQHRGMVDHHSSGNNFYSS